MATVILAAGHGRLPNGGWDPGTTWGPAGKPPTQVEHTLNEQVMWACYDELRVNGVAVKLERGSTRNTNDRLDGNWLRFRRDLDSMPKGAVSLAVEIHHDYYKARRGGFGIVPAAVGYHATRELDVCTAITAAYKAAGLPVRPTYADVRGLGLLRRPKVPTLIWECDRLGADCASPTQTGHALALGILAWLR